MIYYILRITSYYETLNFILYPALISGTVYFIFTVIMIAKQIKEILYLIKENKELIHTINSILQTFPEGVIIRSLDEISRKTLTKFANDVFQNTIAKLIKIDNIEDTDWIVQLKNGEDQTTSFEDFLSSQEDLFIHNPNIKNTIEQMIEIKIWVQQINEENKNSNDEFKVVSSYNVKSIRVVWENNKHSFMHVFVDITSVQNLEKVKATNKWQQLMFSSVSHEF